jgi:hypothetical protein
MRAAISRPRLASIVVAVGITTSSFANLTLPTDDGAAADFRGSSGSGTIASAVSTSCLDAVAQVASVVPARPGMNLTQICIESTTPDVWTAITLVSVAASGVAPLSCKVATAYFADPNTPRDAKGMSTEPTPFFIDRPGHSPSIERPTLASRVGTARESNMIRALVSGLPPDPLPSGTPWWGVVVARLVSILGRVLIARVVVQSSERARRAPRKRKRRHPSKPTLSHGMVA